MRNTVAIVGLGQIGMGYDLSLDPSEHVHTHARAFTCHPRFQLVSGIDPDGRRREIFRRNYSCDAHDSLGGALERHQPDLVVIAVPTKNHGSMLREVLEHCWPKAILCEKPLSYDLAEAESMVKACSSRGIALFVNYMRRSDVGAVEIKRRIETGEISIPIKGVAWYSKGFLHNGSHLFNLLQWWMGPMRDGAILARGESVDEFDCTVDVRAHFEHGQVVMLAGCDSTYSHHSVELVSSSGRLRYDRGGERIEWQSMIQSLVNGNARTLNPQPESILSGMSRYQWHVADQLSLAMEGGSAQLCSGVEALETLSRMRAILDQA